jgi:serine/threonine protein kinase
VLSLCFVRAGESAAVRQLRQLVEYRQRMGVGADEDVLRVIKRHYVDRLLLAATREEFLDVYRDAEERLGTSTKNAIIAVDSELRLTVNGQLNFAPGSESFFFRGLSSGVPCVLKFPPSEQMAKHEVRVFNAVPEGSDGKQHLVPVSIVSVDAPRHRLSRKSAIMMPFYVSTLDSWPTCASMMELIGQVAASVSSALSALHRVRLVHCDCKPGNIFINSEGHAFLGDYDAVVEENQPVQRCTFNFLTRELLLVKQAGILLATPAVDFAMLACTLARMINIPLPSSSGFYATEQLLEVAVKQLSHNHLTAAERIAFDTVRECLVQVQKDPQYTTGLRLQQSQLAAAAADAASSSLESSGNVDWSRLVGVGHPTKT